MAYAKIMFKNEQTNELRVAPVGFSWTVLFFGFFPPLFRSDWKWAIIIFLAACITWGLSNLVFMFFYNKAYIKDLVYSGYKAEAIDVGSLDLVEYKLGIKLPRISGSAA